MAEKSQEVLCKVNNNFHVKPWWLLSVCFCSHYQGHVLGYAIKLFTKTLFKGCFCLFLVAVVVAKCPISWPGVFSSWECVRFPLGLALPPVDPQSFMASLGAPVHAQLL